MESIDLLDRLASFRYRAIIRSDNKRNGKVFFLSEVKFDPILINFLESIFDHSP